MNFQIVLRELVRRAHRELPREPHLHRKRALGLHAYEDALSLTDLGGPLDGPPPAGDSYADLKPALAAAARARAAQLDPLEQEQELRTLTELADRQERHVAELPARFDAAAAPGPEPARDPFVELGPEEPGPHAQLNAALIAAEVAARAACEDPEAAWEDQLERARVVAERLEETVALERRLEGQGQHWGDLPVDVAAFGQPTRS